MIIVAKLGERTAAACLPMAMKKKAMELDYNAWSVHESNALPAPAKVVKIGKHGWVALEHQDLLKKLLGLQS